MIRIGFWDRKGGFAMEAMVDVVRGEGGKREAVVGHIGCGCGCKGETNLMPVIAIRASGQIFGRIPDLSLVTSFCPTIIATDHTNKAMKPNAPANLTKVLRLLRRTF
jgi:hypothetical protein